MELPIMQFYPSYFIPAVNKYLSQHPILENLQSTFFP